ncbi:MAG: tol-pal system-associated acyl-CoA thioesterase [Gammaproteobacteria bacterium]|nr:tol-pal system-associated acyl-CoA thioesterase [Rhodocyclaceae bacterium]MBU3910685.1 tol-pal system-associated acyl-CoA thioesterase [Gammaproteobacteria bacterium]MBU3988529.1 tol-pal system-associated acyl-CoA thioesterase [Gammaproteobacteria bacterium]MBU4003394.1 tol-pal system-associated acyl-CoA thioesterase [Gammaproteobacteria bacterium]MBU4021865.1 tol-pal system-associated acyl-CoA thioesterase [Gammaproteobacteria bacterium]
MHLKKHAGPSQVFLGPLGGGSRTAAFSGGALFVRVYYEDTDAGGVVYYANYLKYLERARTELLRELGFEQHQLAGEAGLAFAVRSLAVEYLKPAKLDDQLEVATTVEALGRAQVTFAQSIRRADETLLTATVRVACLDIARGKATAMPPSLHEKLANRR